MFKSLDIKSVLNDSLSSLKDVSDTAFLDARLLLGYVLGLNQTQILALNDSFLLTENQANELKILLQKRLSNYPIAYLIKHQEFYGRSFYIDEGVLVPRADSEIIIDTVKELDKTYNFKTIRDVGTGSGCLAITLALEIPHSKVIASEISILAKYVFERNNKDLTSNSVELLMLQNYEDRSKVDLIVANLPYLTTDEANDCYVNKKWHEPLLALDGGLYGLDMINALIRQAKGLSKVILLEADPRQMNDIESMLLTNNYTSVERRCDLRGDERIIFAVNRDSL